MSILKKRRKELGLSLNMLEAKSGIGKSMIKKWEDGTISNMRRDSIIKYAAALEVSPLFILYGEDYNNNVLDNITDPNEIKLLRQYRKMSLEKKKLLLNRAEELSILDTVK